MRSAKETKDSAGHLLEVGKSPDVDPVLVDILYSIRLNLYPGLEISVHSEPSSDLAHRLMSADLDIALITQPERNATLTMTKLAETPTHVVLPREHPLADKEGFKLTDLTMRSGFILLAASQPEMTEKDFRIILAHRDLEPTSANYPLAWFQPGRPLAIQGNRAATADAFRHFLTLWAHAEPTKIFFARPDRNWQLSS